MSSIDRIEELKFAKSNYSLEELENFRDSDGFIDLSKIQLEYIPASREKKGTQERLKNWVDFNGTKVLIRGEVVENYSIYSELIVEEIANQLGIESAHYDLIKCKDQEGKEILGVLSESMIDFDKEELITLHDLIGDEQKNEYEYDEYLENTSLDFTIDKLKERFEKVGYSQEDIENLICDYKKRMLFHLSVLDTDKHTENIAFIKNKTGEEKLRLSPNYDSEFSLLLGYARDNIKFLLKNETQLEAEVDIADPKIVYKVNNSKSMWRETLEELCETDEIFDYYMDLMENRVDMNIVLDNVEKKIKAPLPEDVRELAKKAYNIRNQEMEKVYMPDMELDNELQSLLASIISESEKIGIRAGELEVIGKNMERDMQGKQSDVDKEQNINEK